MIKTLVRSRTLVCVCAAMASLGGGSSSLLAGSPYLQTSETDLDALRASRVVPLPAVTATHILGLDALKPAWTNMPGLSIRKDYFGAGNDGLVFVGNDCIVSGRAAYWKLDAVESGRYWVGLWVESGNAGLGTESAPECSRTPAYLNGWPIRFKTVSDPVQVASNRWVAELQTGISIALKAGDELAFSPMWGNGQFLRLVLYRQEPVCGRTPAGQTYGAKFGGLRLRVVAEPQFIGSGEDGAEHEARIQIANPLPYAVDVEIDWTLADYFGKPVAAAVEPAHIAPHATVVISRRFVAQGDAQAYQLDVRTRPAQGFQVPVPRPVEMLELNDFTRVALLPALPGPLEAWNHVRMEMKNDRTGDRMWVSLNGEWQRGDLNGRRVPEAVPPTIAYVPCRIPESSFHTALPKDVFGRWYRKSFRVPDGMRGKNLVLDIGYAKCEGTIFVNGQRVGYGVGGELPLRTDITRAVKQDADNEIVICIRGGIALVGPDFVDRFDPENWSEREGKREVYGSGTAGAFLGPVALRTMPAVRARQILVLPDVANGKLRILTRVENQSAEPRTLELRYRAEQRGRVVASAGIPTRRVDLKPGEMREVEAVGSGRGLAEYTSVTPVLGKLVVEVVENGKVLDELGQRFGYRTVAIRGERIFLNGRPMNFLGSGPFFMLQDAMERESGTDISRCFGPDPVQDGAEACDEVGRFHYLNVGEGSGQPWEKLRSDKFWKSAADTAIELQWEEGSRPGAILWNIWNESYHYAVYATGIEGRDLLAQRLYSVAKALRPVVTPDYWVMSDGDEELGGLLPFCSFHYLNHGGGLAAGYWRNPSHGGYAGLQPGKDSVTAYWPDSFYMTGAARPPKKGTIITGPTPDWAYGSTAAGDTETFWYTGIINGLGNCKYLGDTVALGTAARYTSRGWAWEKTALDAYRDVEMAFIGGLYWHGFQNMIVQDVTFSMPQQEVRHFAGTRFERRVNIHDDDYAPGSLEFSWELRSPQGQVLDSGKQRMQSSTAYLKRTQVAFDVPRVERRTRLTLDMQLRKNGRLRTHEERIVEAWPVPAKAAGAAQPIALFDPSGRARPVLEKLGQSVKVVSALTPAGIADSRVLVVGPDCAASEMPAERKTLLDFMSQGGRILILQQQEAGFLPVDTYFENRLYSSQGFVRTGDHPVMKGLQDLDFQVWNPGHLMARGAYRKPPTGNVLTLVDCGQDGSMAWTPLFEVFAGSGSMVVCQLPMLTALDSEPMCAELWGRLLAYLAQPVYRQADRRLAVLDGASAPVLARLKQIRADHDVIGAPDARHPVTLLEMNQADLGSRTEAISAYVKNGGTLILHRVRPEHQAWLTALIGRPVEVGIQPYRGWVDRQILDRRTGLVEGLNNLDFYWRRVVEGESGDSSSQVSAGVKEGRGQVEYVVRVAEAADYLFPGGLVEVPVGQGRVIVDQVKWETSEDGLGCGSAKRIVATMLTNLGIIQRPPVPRAVLPRNVKYVPIDLSAVANRGLVDKVSGDGEGWLEWGPGADLSAFPTGDITLGGVPFSVPTGDKNAIMLRVSPDSVKALAGYPARVTIPVNASKVAGLWFLHTGGWAYGDAPFGFREIRYADGSREIITLNGANMADWNYGRDQFPDEEGTTTTVAWKGSNQVYACTRVYKTLWVNPHPGKDIKEVVLSTEGLPQKQWRVIPHLGLTVAVLTEGTATRDPVRAASLLKAAEVLAADGRPKDAVASLEAAVTADDQNISAWQTWVTLLIKDGNATAVRNVCERWMAAMPASYVACNVLADYLDKQGQTEEALRLYRRSLDIEWNQPPALQAIQRLEKKKR